MRDVPERTFRDVSEKLTEKRFSGKLQKANFQEGPGSIREKERELSSGFSARFSATAAALHFCRGGRS